MQSPTFVGANRIDDIRPSSDDDAIVESFGIAKGERVLEIGNSTGLFSVCLAMNGCNVSVLNSNASAAECIRRSAEKNNVRIDVRESSSFEDAVGEYDTIILNFMYAAEEAVELGMIRRAIEQAPIFMKKSSRIIIVTPALLDKKKLNTILSADLLIKKEVKMKSSSADVRITEVVL